MPDDRDPRTAPGAAPGAANAQALPGDDNAIAPADPPVVPASTDAEAAGTPPGPATRAAAPDAGPRTPAARDAAPDPDPTPRTPDPTGLPATGTTPSLVWLAVVVALLVILLLSLWSGS